MPNVIYIYGNLWVMKAYLFICKLFWEVLSQGNFLNLGVYDESRVGNVEWLVLASLAGNFLQERCWS